MKSGKNMYIDNKNVEDIVLEDLYYDSVMNKE